jgi:hypothetical protein
MSAPVLLTSSRLNVGGYGVRVIRGQFVGKKLGGRLEPIEPPPPGVAAGIEFWMTTPYVECLRSYAVGTVSAAGALSLKRKPWQIRHYRRAVMGGAGVYRLGLWAFLAARRPAAQPSQTGAALGGMNGAAQLNALSRAAHGRVKHSLCWKTPRRRYERGLASESVMRRALHDALTGFSFSGAADNAGPRYRWLSFFEEEKRPRPQYTGTSESLAQFLAAVREELRRLALRDEGQKPEHERAARQLRRALRRMVARRVNTQRSAACLPQPLHAQPKPPAAPLAPPPLA